MSANRWDPSPPTGRHDFEIAIMCALSLEAEAVTALFDKRWDSKTYGKATGDTNTYSIGAIGCHNVVLVHLPNMGKVAAATAAAFLRISYERIKLALVVGICGGVPFGKSSNDEILLGDVVVSDGIIQYDFGRQYPHKFIRKDHVRDNLPRPSPPMRTFLAKLQAKQTRSRLQEQTLEYLKILQELDNTATYPGVTEDRLFKPTYRHKHHELLECQVCGSGTADVCDTALKLSCEHLGCNEQELVFRARSTRLPGMPVIHFGLIASGDSVMKSGEDRDSAAFRDEFIAFEMEGAGVWETFPSCLIIKGVCDYADSHKSKRWQAYAAATAAATTKAVLENWNTETVDHLSSLSPHHPILTATDTVPLNPARKVAIFKTLYTSPYRDRKERNPDRVPRTCEWFVAHNSFQQWRESTSSSMLWVSADPGCGKSVLAKYLVDSQLPTTESRTTCYFFFKDDFADQRSAKSALCCILHQLFKQREILLSNKIAERFETDGEHLTGSFGELWDVLVTASQDKNAGEIVCILDAFDECEDHGRSELTRCLHKFYSTKNNFNLKFLLTSRPYGDIRRGFQSLEIPGLPVIHLSGESEIEMKKIAREIDIYIKAKVRSIREILRLKPVEEQLLLQKLLSIPNRTYLWAHLTLDLVQNDINIDKTGISKATSQLPQTVDEAYERILTKSRNFEEAKKLLHIVVVAARPLTLSEMNLALALRESHRSYKDLDLRLEERFREPRENSWFKMALQVVERATTISSNGNIHSRHESLIVFFHRSVFGTCFSLSLRPILLTITGYYPNTFETTTSLTTLLRTGLPTSECHVLKTMQ
ncbi:purine and uridine phosphorylase [Xylariaceae sp. AK1471]|nr:purine and uridine phosphorylase [Xylariaceae sp. AK1471]